jgi:hypothetical protein
MKVLVCGSRTKIDYCFTVFIHLAKLYEEITEIIEGCCPNSADAYAEEYAKYNNINIRHFPSEPRNYLKRNIEMVQECDMILAFWDGYSYGTAFTIARGVMNNKKVKVVNING